MKKLGAGIQSFDKLVTQYLYVDKTREVYNIVTSGECFFLSRPRRFGKSLFCSTLDLLFKGRRDLFKGLWIDSSDYDWKEYPVIYLSMSNYDLKTPETLERSLLLDLGRLAKHYGVMLQSCDSSKDFLAVLVQELYHKAPVVIIIDEYDKPILDHLQNKPMAIAMRDALANFYGALKGLDAYLRFTFLTGVSKIAKTSVFSGLNHLTDLSFDARAATLCGLTERELVANFSEHLRVTAIALNRTEEVLLGEMRAMYDGYKFHLKQQDAIYNPYSVVRCFDSKELLNYWFASGAPRFLIDIIKKANFPAQDLDQTTISTLEIDTFDIESEIYDGAVIRSLLLQTGYTTIKSFDDKIKEYVVGYPNTEVRESLNSHILHALTLYGQNVIGRKMVALREALAKNSITEFINVLQTFYAGIPYEINLRDEKYYQTVFLLIVQFIGAEITVEEDTNLGRIDAVIRTKTHIYVFEFKASKSPAQALKQIEEKKYPQKFQHDGKKIVIVGMNFILEERNIASEYLIKEL